MKKVLFYFTLVVVGFNFTNCQRKQVLHTIAPPATYYSQNTPQTSNTENQSVASEIGAEQMVIEKILAEKPKENYSETIEMIASASNTLTSNKALARTQKVMNNAKVKQFMGKVEMTQNPEGNYVLAAKQGQKLNAVEKLVVKKMNKVAASPNKKFNEWNKFLRYGIILLAIALVLSIIGWFIPFLWIINAFVWLAGWILFIYGLGIELEWW
ncbi:MAG: hypothetical protein ACK4GN_17325 [Runella sp.]